MPDLNMEKNNLNCENSSSFMKSNGKQRSTRSIWDAVTRKLDRLEAKGCDHKFQIQPDHEFGLNNDKILLEQVDQFIESNASQIPDCFQPFLDLAESKIAIYEQREASVVKFGQNQDDDAWFFEALGRVSKIINRFDGFSFDSGTNSCLNRAGCIHHRAMLLFEHEFGALLDNFKRSYCNTYLDSKTPKTPKQSFFNSNQETDRCINESKTEDEFPYFSPQSMANMNQIANAMILARYETECCMVYTGSRLKALDVELNKQGFENINMDDVQRMNLESLEREINNWIYIVKHCTTTLFPAERKLCNTVFSEHHLIEKSLFFDLVRSLTLRLLKFPNALVLTKRYSTEKLFKFLDMYETLRDLVLDHGDDSPVQDLAFEISLAQCRIGEAVVGIFCQLEDSIKCDNGRIPVASGAVHPLTRYTMNYLEYACEYKDTIEQVFQRKYEMQGSMGQNADQEVQIKSKNAIENDYGSPKTSPFSVELKTVMDSLDANIEMKSRLYRDPALRYIFLMNNGRYILQKIKGSTEIFEMMGHSWSRKRTSELRQYHKNYQRETWSKVLHCINHEGLQINGKVSKAILKERIKNFNNMFEEILKTQSTWVVSDSQLQSELRVSISAVMIPAYRSFLGRLKSYLDGKQAEKCIKYQPEDIEGLMEQLFDGNATSMGRKRT